MDGLMGELGRKELGDRKNEEEEGEGGFYGYCMVGYEGG